jgi:hypothetical protein
MYDILRQSAKLQQLKNEKLLAKEAWMFWIKGNTKPSPTAKDLQFDSTHQKLQYIVAPYSCKITATCSFIMQNTAHDQIEASGVDRYIFIQLLFISHHSHGSCGPISL